MYVDVSFHDYAYTLIDWYHNSISGNGDLIKGKWLFYVTCHFPRTKFLIVITKKIITLYLFNIYMYL